MTSDPRRGRLRERTAWAAGRAADHTTREPTEFARPTHERRPTENLPLVRAAQAVRPGPSSAFRAVALATSVATYALVVLGSTVRVTESGMGCPDWPLCRGGIGPVYRFHPILEQSHRYLAAAVSAGVVALAVMAWRAVVAPGVVRLAISSLGVLGVQVALGAVTVFSSNAPWTVALHFSAAMLLLALVVALAVRSFVPATAELSGHRVLRRSAVTSTFLLIVTGAVVVGRGAGGACRSWPWCHPTDRSGLVLPTLQLIHRLMAGAAVTLLAAFAVSVLFSLHSTDRALPQASAARVALWALLALLPLQVLAGALSALSGAGATQADLHLALGSALWSCTVALAVVTSAPRVDGHLPG